MTDYEALTDRAKSNLIETYSKEIESQCYKKGILEKGLSAVSNTKMAFDDFDFECKLLLKREGKSSFGNFYYAPCIFLGTNQLQRENRMELAFLCLLLEKIQGYFPDIAFFIDSRGGQHSIKLGKSKSEINIAINDIQNFKEKEPKLILNKHCSLCSFQSVCRGQAIKDDNLTLLNRITPKQLNRLEKKGIFTINQLSYVYKSRRKNKHFKNSVNNYKPELQALAIRTKKIYIQTLPTLDRRSPEIFLDVECIPEESFYYLFGVLILENDKQAYHSFWSDTPEDEGSSWREATHLLQSYPEASIYYYGSFEAKAFEVMSKRHKTNIEHLKKRLINLNTSIYGKIYFPTYSNGLKQLGQSLGMKWTDEKASGLQSIVWRSLWSEGRKDYKRKILVYNQEDCIALKRLTDELTRIQTESAVYNDVDFVENPKKPTSETGQVVHDQFELIFKLAHSYYDRKKIRIDLAKQVKETREEKPKNKNGFRWLGKKMAKPSKTTFMAADRYCFKHPNRKLNKSKIKSKRVLIDLIFGKNGVRKTVVEYVGSHGYCPICNNSYPPVCFRQLSRQLYGHNYKSWFVFQRIELQLPFSKINECLHGLINDKIGTGYGSSFIKDFSQYYERTEKIIIQKISNSPFIHVDETTVSIAGQNQYVWIFTTDNYVTFRLSKSREGITAKDFLQGYKGVLISDFYSGYDALECEQQKCWVHFLRDLNNSLWNNPFDKQYEDFVCEVRNVILPIIQESYQHGLKKRFFAKHHKSVDRFYGKVIENKPYKSELCRLYQKRMKRYRDSLFTFMKHDGINWHNNAAENGIRHVCVQRKISGSFGGDQFPHYLRMVSIMRTCKLQHKSFFKFLLSKDLDIDLFLSKKKKRI